MALLLPFSKIRSTVSPAALFIRIFAERERFDALDKGFFMAIHSSSIKKIYSVEACLNWSSLDMCLVLLVASVISFTLQLD